MQGSVPGSLFLFEYVLKYSQHGTLNLLSMSKGNFCIMSQSNMEAQFAEKGRVTHLHSGIEKGHERKEKKICKEKIMFVFKTRAETVKSKTEIDGSFFRQCLPLLGGISGLWCYANQRI